MNLSQLYYFRKLAELQHFTRAASELYITQPALSNSMSHLEKELGIPLFEREGRTVKLTRYGKEFYHYTCESLNALERGVALAREHAGSYQGSIDIGTIYTIQGDYLPALLHAYRDQYGRNIRFNLFQGLSLPLIEDLENDRYEVVFSAYIPGKPHLTFVPVLSQQLIALVHRSHSLAWRDELSIDDLHDAKTIVTYPPETPVGAEVEQLIKAHGITATDTSCNDEITLGSVVDSMPESVGLSLNTIGLAPFRTLISKRLKEVTPDFHQVCLVYKTSAYKTRAVENFIEFVRSFSWDQRI
ncbi:MAG: LysR family transcriptional regulator [Slackia sp.]|nr:LysR family transcriptional regulator [Slackia sp.]